MMSYQEQRARIDELDAMLRRYRVATDVLHERERQDAKWGEQNHPIGTSTHAAQFRDSLREECDRAAKSGRLTWKHILFEEVYEALAETDPVKQRAELVQCAAVLFAMIECLDRRSP